jgi:DNA-binding PadR family transcriptional regulator
MKDLTVPEQLILTAIWRLKENAYGVTIRKKVAEVTKKDIIYGTLYNFLDQLLRKNYVTKTQSAPTKERGGRSKVMYQITEEGYQALTTARNLNESIWSEIPENAFIKNKANEK